MPLYEFRCDSCGKKFAQLVGVTADSRDPQCKHCGSREVTRLISRFTRARSEDEKLDSLEEAALMGDSDDPKTMRRMMGEMAREMSDELGEDVDELLDETEREMYGEGDAEE